MYMALDCWHRPAASVMQASLDLDCDYSLLFDQFSQESIPMNCWIFKCNPDRYRLDERLSDPEQLTTWLVSRYHERIAAGDLAFIWQTGGQRGIRATIRIDSSPEDLPELDSEQKYRDSPDTKIACRVYATFLRRDLNLPAASLQSVPGLENLSVFHGFQQTTNFEVTTDEATILLRSIQ